jgi:hypothetical protein
MIRVSPTDDGIGKFCGTPLRKLSYRKSAWWGIVATRGCKVLFLCDKGREEKRDIFFVKTIFPFALCNRSCPNWAHLTDWENLVG